MVVVTKDVTFKVALKIYQSLISFYKNNCAANAAEKSAMCFAFLSELTMNSAKFIVFYFRQPAKPVRCHVCEFL